MTIKKNRGFRQWLYENSTWLLALAFAIVNIFLTYKLTPLVEDIRVLQTKVNAMEKVQDKMDTWLIRIEGKIDNALLMR